MRRSRAKTRFTAYPHSPSNSASGRILIAGTMTRMSLRPTGERRGIERVLPFLEADAVTAARKCRGRLLAREWKPLVPMGREVVGTGGIGMPGWILRATGGQVLSVAPLDRSRATESMFGELFAGAFSDSCVLYPSNRDGESVMSRRVVRIAVLAALVVAGGVAAQGRILDMVANKVITKYQNASCQQLWQQKGQPKSAEEQKAVQFLRNDAQARTAFLNQVAGPIANKMFECGMIP